MLIHSPQELAMTVTNQRKKIKMSQKTAADLVGLKQQTISAFENKPGSTELDTLFRILAAVNLDAHIVTKDKKNIKTSQWKEEW
jgi:HTH-type transcriptional regulator/antitoxin HipB